MKGYEFQPASETERTQKGGLYRRGHYDLVILNPDFVKNYPLKIVCGKNYKELQSIESKFSAIPLIWACEIIFFPKTKQLPENAIKTIRQDALKIKETKNRNFCKIGSVHVFTGHLSGLTAQLEQQVREFADREQIEIAFTTAITYGKEIQH